MTIDMYLSVESVWSCIGFAAARQLFDQHALQVRYRPVALQPLFAATGGVPFRQRHPARQRYRDYEVQRWCAVRGVDLHLDSPHLPPQAEMADRMVIALGMCGMDPAAFVARVFQAVWQDRADAGDPQVLRDCLRDAGLRPEQADRARALCISSATNAAYAQNLSDAVVANVFGLPAFVWHGEVFWGQDRIEMLGEAIASGRAPFLPFR